MSRLKETMSLRELTEQGVVFEVDTSNVDEKSSSDEEDDTEVLRRKFEHINKECVGIFDEDTYEEGAPFETISKKMFNLIPNGKIKKRVIREGDGEQPEEYASVSIHYSVYLEGEDLPYDSTYVRKKPKKFTVGTGEILAGIDHGVRTMKVNEKSQFLVQPEYAYGKNCIGFPPNTTVLIEVELLEVVNSGAAITFEKLSEEEQRRFPEVYKYCTALNKKGKQSFTERNIKNAIKYYNTAAVKLEKVILSNKEEIEQHRELSLKLYSNLLVSYTRQREAKKGCLNAKKIYDLTSNGELMKIPPKVYFNHGKCLRLLGEYDSAKEMLEKARALEPKNPDVANELLNLEKEKNVYKSEQVRFAKALFSNK